MPVVEWMRWIRMTIDVSNRLEWKWNKKKYWSKRGYFFPRLHTDWLKASYFLGAWNDVNGTGQGFSCDLTLLANLKLAFKKVSVEKFLPSIYIWHKNLRNCWKANIKYFPKCSLNFNGWTEEIWDISHAFLIKL